MPNSTLMQLQDVTAGSGFRHKITVRYGECDMQGVVFNPNYLVYADDVCDRWLIVALGGQWNTGFDCVVKKATLQWHSPARHGDTIDLALTVERWGNTSFDVRVRASVADRPVVTIDLVYISIEPGSQTPVAVPSGARRALAVAAA